VHDTEFNDNTDIYEIQDRLPIANTFCSYDLDLDPMTLIDELDLNVMKTYLHTNNELKAFRSCSIADR